ncbi:MAG: HNH endonuclease [Enterobacter asburiae]|nr:HNH endonuclease [Enterobacter asburiae]MDU0855792.1 HNH endonuclease [Enterobacter asburiae]MDU1105748.1 HNH endonuclease [Enterobacter sp.]
MTETIKREKVNDTVKMSLLTEVQGKCPICRKPLITRKKNSNTSVRVFDIAHIYPLNATDDEVELLKNEEKLSENIDSEENFIALCKTCHKIYDTKKTVKEYRKLVEIKKIYQ